jgi:hypothetical protein
MYLLFEMAVNLEGDADQAIVHDRRRILNLSLTIGLARWLVKLHVLTARTVGNEGRKEFRHANAAGVRDINGKGARAGSAQPDLEYSALSFDWMPIIGKHRAYGSPERGAGQGYFPPSATNQCQSVWRENAGEWWAEGVCWQEMYENF